MPDPGARPVLHLYGPARLEFRRAPLPLRSKGLALLYYLALEGPTRRERVADLLWNHADAANNLRVELHRLRRALQTIGLRAFEHGQDPLRLPDLIALERIRVGDREPLLGLDDLARGFQAWLEHQRLRLGSHESPRAPLRLEQVEAVAEAVQFPFLLILKGPPGSGRRSFARTLAQRLALPFVEGDHDRGAALHYLSAEHPTEPHGDGRTTQRLLARRRALWVVSQSSFQRESPFLLQLRNAFPASRARFLELGALPWCEAREHLLDALPFHEAARLYAHSGGHLAFLNELLQLRPPNGFEGDLPLPQRVRAAFLLAAHELPAAARRALDALSLHPGPLPAELLADLDGDAIDALELHGWLRFHEGWRFRDETTRRIVYGALPGGRRHHGHTDAAAALASGGDPVAESYHREQAGLPLFWPRLQASVAPWARAVLQQRADPAAATTPALRVPVALGDERALLLEHHAQLQADEAGGRLHWVRRPELGEASLAEFILPDAPCVLRLRGRAFLANALGIGIGGTAVPLELRFVGPRPRRVVFAAVAQPDELSDDTLLLPLTADFEVLLLVDQRTLRLESRAEAGVMELTLRAHALRRVGAPAGVGRAALPAPQAYDLRGLPRRTAGPLSATPEESAP